MASTNQQANQAAAAANDSLPLFQNLDNSAVEHYVGDKNVDFNKTAIIYAFRNLYWIVYEGYEGQEGQPPTRIKFGWIEKERVGKYLILEFESAAPDIPGTWKIHSAKIQWLRERSSANLANVEDVFRAGLLTPLEHLRWISDELYELSRYVSTEDLRERREMRAEAEAVAGEFTDYEGYARDGIEEQGE